MEPKDLIVKERGGKGWIEHIGLGVHWTMWKDNHWMGHLISQPGLGGGSGEGVSEITQLFLPQLGGRAFCFFNNLIFVQSFTHFETTWATSYGATWA